MKKKQWILGLLVLAAFVALFLWGRQKFHFDFHVFREQIAQADWRKILIGLLCIYFAYFFRAFRWARLLKHHQKVSPMSLLGPQIMGFTAIALIGRVADPVRPYLVSRKTGLPLSSQFAVYIVERLFDAGSMALIFSMAMLWIPEADIARATSHSGMIASMQKHSPLLGTILARYGGLVLTLAGAIFLVAVRLSGQAVATFFEHTFGLVSKKLGVAVGEKIRTFHSGLDTMRTFGEFAATAALSLGMWLLIAFAYFITCRAFSGSPQLVAISPQKCVLLMIASGGASIFQLPVLGWFTQIGIVAAAITGLFGASPEASTACAATLLLVTFLGTIPIGLIWAQFEHISLRKVTHESEEEAEHIPTDPPAAANPEPL
ncbi:MAG TPA: lysylphosphatidylglycerol synthase transmembrane domain-containing protein [Terracidiphilus sp.]|nr:lysylphosphatidylglycerol synthase transmembrane domain-containing protein [Terracidiphilus sp.]